MRLIMIKSQSHWKNSGAFWQRVANTFFNKQMLVAASVKSKNIKKLAFSFQLTVSSGDMNKAM